MRALHRDERAHGSRAFPVQRTPEGMPKYYKNKIFTEKEREKMWINNLNRGLLWVYGEKVKADDWRTIDNLREYWQRYGREVMGDNPIAWNAMKERRKEEKQRRAIAEAKKQAEKFSTENLIELPLQADFPMQENKTEWGDIIDQYIKENMWTFERVRSIFNV